MNFKFSFVLKDRDDLVDLVLAALCDALGDPEQITNFLFLQLYIPRETKI